MKALIITDIQNDFLPGGALAVKGGNEIVPLVNRLQEKFELVVATQDWHPRDHGSFASAHKKRVGEKIQLAGLEQVLWPDHCVEYTYGAEFSKDLKADKIARVFHKGTDKTIDSYSSFFDNGHKKATGLDTYLKEKKANDVYIVGLATDYCIKYSVLDALTLGFKTFVILPACRGIDLEPGDVEMAVKEMSDQGAYIIKDVKNL